MSNPGRVMLRDLVEFVQNPYPWHLAPMGYVREVMMTAQRARDAAAAWSSHINSTRRFIEESAEQCDIRATVLVVGSGNLLDVPVDTLSRTFKRVVLLDIFHTRDARRAVQERLNVEMVSADVTGVARAVFDAARRRDVSVLPKSTPPVLEAQKFDLIISVNLLSQLGVIPCNFLRGHCSSIPPAQLSAFTRDLIDTHLYWLDESAEQVCLITDVLRVEEASSGAVTQKDIVEGVDLPAPDETWDWRIAPEGSIYKDREMIHRVYGYRDFRLLDDRP